MCKLVDSKYKLLDTECELEETKWKCWENWRWCLV